MKKKSNKKSNKKSKTQDKRICRGVKAYMEMVGMDVRHWTR